MRPELEVIVVLGCRIEEGGRPSPAALRRVERAAAAFREQPGALVLASGGRLWHGVSEAEAFARALAAQGVPRAAIELESRSLTTRENASFSERWLRERGVTRVGLVTCDWHMPRATAHFHRLGLTPRPLAAVSPEKPYVVARLRSLRERASFLWAALLPAPLHGLVRFFR